jgi:hypothetical protein
LRIKPLLARGHGEAAAQTAAPVQRRGQRVVSAVPPRVLHHGERHAAEHGVLRVCARHRFILEWTKHYAFDQSTEEQIKARFNGLVAYFDIINLSGTGVTSL